MFDEYEVLVADIGKAIQKSGVSIDVAIAAMNFVKEHLQHSTAFSGCIISDDGNVYRKEGEK